MKKKLLFIIAFLALLPTAYTVYAWLSIRGVRIYLVGTEKGAFLAATWQWTLLAAVVLWLPVVIALLRKITSLIRGDRDLVVPQFETASATQTTKDIIEPRGAAATDETELIEPLSPAAAQVDTMPETVVVDSRGDTALLQASAANEETVLLQESAAEEVPAPAAETAAAVEEVAVPVAGETPALAAEPVAEETPAPAAEPVIEEASAPAETAGETVLLQPEITESTQAAPKTTFCSQCGKPVRSRFCTFCGAKVEE